MTLNPGQWARFTLALNGSEGVRHDHTVVTVPGGYGVGACLKDRWRTTNENCTRLGRQNERFSSWGSHYRQDFSIGGAFGASQVVQLYRGNNVHSEEDAVIVVSTPAGNVTVTLPAFPDPDKPPPPIEQPPPPACTDAKPHLVELAQRYHDSNRVRAAYAGNWARVLKAFGVDLTAPFDSVAPYTAADADASRRQWAGWNPFYHELRRIEACP